MENVQKKKSTLRVVGNVAFYVVLAIVLFYAVFALFSNKDENRITFFGSTALSVQSGSMEPTFKEGDLIFVKTNFDPADFVDGETIITFVDTVQGREEYVTHRIVRSYTSGGLTRYVTKGDANSNEDSRHLLAQDIVGVWTESKWSGFGTFADGFTNFIKSSLGFFLLIVLPAVAFLVYEVIKFVKVYAEYNNKKTAGDRLKLQEEAIAEAKRQLEEEAKKQKEAEEKK